MRRLTLIALLTLCTLAAGSPAHARAAAQCFPETGQCIDGAFLDYWLANGALAQQGLPLTGVLDEVSPFDGHTYRVQYFERARFEYHPEHEPPYDLLLGLLGREQYRARPPSPYLPSAQEQQLADLMRADPQQRRAALRYNPILARVAHKRAADMAARGYFGHVNPDGQGPNALVRQAGYALPAYYGTAPAANNIEAIAAGRATATEIWQLLLGSDAHRTHVLGLHPFYAAQLDYGIGYVAAPSSAYGHYWVIITAQPGP